jgi:hypothetical protein
VCTVLCISLLLLEMIAVKDIMLVRRDQIMFAIIVLVLLQ